MHDLYLLADNRQQNDTNEGFIDAPIGDNAFNANNIISETMWILTIDLVNLRPDKEFSVERDKTSNNEKSRYQKSI